MRKYTVFSPTPQALRREKLDFPEKFPIFAAAKCSIINIYKQNQP